MGYMFRECRYIGDLPLFDTSKVTDMKYMFGSGSSARINSTLKIIPAWDVRNVTNFDNMFAGCVGLTEILMYGMKVSCRVVDGVYGNKLGVENLITILSNCQVVTDSPKLTVGSSKLASIAEIYVKETGVEPYEGLTLRPCVICESTDEGAMLATDYFMSKGWTIS